MLLASLSFTLIIAVILIVVFLDLVDAKIGLILMFIGIGCQQLFNGFIFYKEDKKFKKFYILVGISCFVFAFWLVLKTYYLL